MATHNINTYMSTEFTNSNYYVLTFKLAFNNPCAFVFGHNPVVDGLDGVYLYEDHIETYRDGQLQDNVTLSNNIGGNTNKEVRIVRDGVNFSFIVEDELIYQTNLIYFNTIGTYMQSNNVAYHFSATDFQLEPLVTTNITPSVDDYDGTVYGSDIHLEIDNDKLNMMDYGMLPNGAIGSAKVIVKDVPLPTDDLELKLQINYNNTRFSRLSNLDGEMQMRVYEDVLTSDTAKEYSKVLCSPMPVNNVRTVFTRHSEEGILYYIEDDGSDDLVPTYLTNAYAQYKGGCEIKTETGIFLFDLDNAHSPIIVDNNLVRATFHRRSGYIQLSRYDDETGDWVIVNTLKLKKNPQLSLVDYNDDYCELNFGKTNWKFYRGRPFIVCKHEEDDFRILDLVDRVYCETMENNRGMSLIEEHDALSSTFAPQLSVQQFPQDLHIGQSIRADNFALYGVTTNNYLTDDPTTATMEVVDLNSEKAIKITKTSGKIALNFPSYANYVKRIGDTFSLLLDNVLVDNETSITVKARGYDDRGCVPIYENIQYGIWEQSKNLSVANCLKSIDGSLADNNDTSSCENKIMPSNVPTIEFANHLKVTFTDCPSEVKYIDFVVILNGTTASTTYIKNLMYYDSDVLLSHEVDTSRAYAEQVEILFDKTYYANIYNEDSDCGLCIIRPNQNKIGLRHIYANDETVFVPYMKRHNEWDDPSQIFLEYINSKQQIIDIDWEN